MNNLWGLTVRNYLETSKTHNISAIRFASKKSSGNTRNKKSGETYNRGWKKQDGHHVQPGDILLTQKRLRFHPGLNVKRWGPEALIALKPGIVRITCETPDLNWDLSIVQALYGQQPKDVTFFKKYYNVIPHPQHNRFKLIDQI